MSRKVSFLVSRTAPETPVLSSTGLQLAVAYADFCYISVVYLLSTFSAKYSEQYRSRRPTWNVEKGS